MYPKAFLNLNFMLRYAFLLRRMHRRWLSEFPIEVKGTENEASDEHFIVPLLPNVHMHCMRLILSCF